MGTRSLTKVIQTWKDESGVKQSRPITCMYRQYDGYLEGHGVELAEWLEKFTIVNGIGLYEDRRIANGMDCLSAQMFVHFKSSGCKDDGTPTSTAGSIYCMHPDSDDCGEEYLYEISEEDSELIITATDVWKNEVIFKGEAKELLTKLKENA